MNAPSKKLGLLVSRSPPSQVSKANGGLRSLLTRGVLPNRIDSVRFVCDRDEAQARRVTVNATGLGKKAQRTALSPELRAALERCFLRFHARSGFAWSATATHPEVWEWWVRFELFIRRTRIPRIAHGAASARAKARISPSMPFPESFR